jgi:proliferating cell nuclear antigen
MNQMRYFRLKLDAPDAFIKLMKILGKLLDYAELSISYHSLNLVAMDSSHILNVNLQLPGEFFNEYTITLERKIRIDLQEFNKILARARGEVLFLMDSGTENKLLVQFQSDHKRNFKLPLLDAIDSDNPVETIEYNASVGLMAEYLAEIIGDARLASDYATFALVPDILGDYLSIDTQNTKSDLEFDVQIKSFAEKPIVAKKQESQYSLVYLSDVVKLKDVATKVFLQFSSEMPLNLEYVLEHNGKVNLTLAPRVADDDESEEPKDRERVPDEEESDSEEEPDDTEWSEADESESKENNEKVHEHIATVYKRNGKKKKPEVTEAKEP